MKIKGLVLEIQKNKVIVLTPDGQFRSLPKRGKVKVGDEYTYTVSLRPYLAVAASLALLLMSSVFISSVYDLPLFAGKAENTDPVLVAQNDAPATASDLPPVKNEQPDPQKEDVTPAPDPAEKDTETPVEPAEKTDPVETTENTPQKPQPPSKPQPQPPKQESNVKQEPPQNQEPAKEPAGEEPVKAETDEDKEQEEQPADPDPEVVVAEEEEPIFDEANRGGLLSKWFTDLSDFFTGGKSK